ncbi:MAG: fibrobacter succinogenes major paralogous domain-containing protein [Fibrobacter sp.]|nr:fibrobacter succinogenes major paralogous domain-containing protein [Fibrobacter sp.]
MNIRFLFFAMFALSLLLSACSESFTDSRDGQSYDVVKIGNLSWMAENLNYATEMSVCPDGDSRNCKRLGRLYTWAEARSVCPEGWRLPTKEDFESLVAAQYSSQSRAGAALKSRDGWFKKGNGSDEFGFNALPAGYRGAVLTTDDGTVTGGKFDGIGGYAYFWSADEDAENPESNAFYLFLSFSSDAASINAFAKEDYRSVRCVTP